jgi:CRISPR system Cascade subunit CasD
VRVDQPGRATEDYQTISGFPQDALGYHLRAALAEQPFKKVSKKNPRLADLTVPADLPPVIAPDDTTQVRAGLVPNYGAAYAITRRWFLAGAEFLVAVEHDERIQEIAAAVRRPVFMPYLGRKPFAPTFPFYLGHTAVPGADLLAQAPTLARDARQAGSTETLAVHPITGERNIPIDWVPARQETKEEWLSWFSTSLSR